MAFESARVTVMVPVYNVRRYLVQCLDSVVGQTYRDLEVILVDDGSSDGSAGVCDEYASRDPRVRVVHTANKGLATARNTGVEESSSDYLLFVDADDWIEPHTVEVLLGWTLATDAGMVCCRSRREWANGSRPSPIDGGMLTLEGDAIMDGVLARGLIRNVSWGKLYRRSLFDGVRYPDDHAYEDIFTAWRLCANARKVLCIPDSLFHYRARASSITGLHDVGDLVDYWSAFLQRYEIFSSESESYREACVQGCLNAIGKVWASLAACPAEGRKRYRVDVEKMRCFAREHLREVLVGPYAMKAKALCLLGCCATPLVWWPIYAGNRVRRALLMAVRKPFE